MRSVRKPWWQQATALVTVSAGGVITGLNFVPGAATTMTSPASVPLHLLALEQAAQPGTFTNLAVGGDTAATATSDAQLRAAIVNVAGYYARLAKTRTPTQMEALIWDNTSSDGADHGESCAAFASLTLELAAQAVGQQSWVTGGESYPWPMPEWADARVDTNPASPQITSVVGDAQAHGRWHQVGDGYQPQAGDWAVYDGHVEVVTSYADGVFDTIGADSLPGLTVNAHSSSAPLAEQGVAGFVDNGDLKPTSGALAPSAPPAGHASSPAPAQSRPAGGNAKDSAAKPAPAATAPEPASAGHTGTSASPAIPGVLGTGDLLGRPAPGTGTTSGQGEAAAAADPTPSIPGLAGAGATTGAAKATGTAVVPGAVPTAAAATPASHPAAAPSAAPSASPRTSARPASTPSAPSSSAGQRYATPGTTSQQAFISLVAPGAIAAQQRFGVPAAVTIAQAIEESAWGQSGLAAQYHNLFGIKGTGPAGSVSLPTSEYEGGQWVTIDAPFRVYHNDAESIADHAELLATSGYYTRAMADRAVPDAFANDLTGVYATDPNYGANLVALMKLYNLYQFDSASGSANAPTPATTPTPAASPSVSPSPSTSPSTGATPSSNTAVAPTPTATAPTPAPSTSGATPAPSTAAPAASGTAGTSTATGGRIPGVVSPGGLAPTAVTPTTGTPTAGTPRTPAPSTSAGPARSTG
ncbi:MAG: glycoside hydrolase family 73 protein, partial [Trebonia sp.]